MNCDPTPAISHAISADDVEFRRAFEACETPAAAFDHAAHLRLAYVYLCAYPLDVAAERIKASLLDFLAHLGIGQAKYHETITRAWMIAVDHFMANSSPCASASAFLAANPGLLDSNVMLQHYSADRLFSADASRSFALPDIRALPLPRAAAAPLPPSH
jgi:hypothetical protein